MLIIQIDLPETTAIVALYGFPPCIAKTFSVGSKRGSSPSAVDTLFLERH